MGRAKKRAPERKRVGAVSYYFRNGAWHVYYRQGKTQVRRRVADNEDEAAKIAAQINAQLSQSAPTPFSFSPISIPDLRIQFLAQHELVRHSTLATVSRYRAATQHLENFTVGQGKQISAHELQADEFVKYLRNIEVAPNGHTNSAKRKLRDKGIQYILQACRSMFIFAARQRHLPPYLENPFKALGIDRFRVEDAKSIYCFDEATELAFFRAADAWTFPIHFTLAKAGLRPGELMHLLISDLDLEKGWLQVRNKIDLGWRVKTGRERAIPLAPAIDRPVSFPRKVTQRKCAMEKTSAADLSPSILIEPVGPRRYPLRRDDKRAQRLGSTHRLHFNGVGPNIISAASPIEGTRFSGSTSLRNRVLTIPERRRPQSKQRNTIAQNGL